MGKIKFTKGELKKQRDALKQYERFLPTLQLKKQQLQVEIVHALSALKETRRKAADKRADIERWIGILTDKTIDISPWITPGRVVIDTRNVAGVDLPVFERVEFMAVEYDLFIVPLWVDNAIEALRGLVSILEEIRILESAIAVLRAELRITTQRVNLFEKVKIPEAEEVIRLIKIYIGDQMVNAVGRSKIAKRKIENEMLQGAGV